MQIGIMFRRSILLLIVLSFISCSNSKKEQKDFIRVYRETYSFCWLYVTNKIGILLLEKVLDLFFHRHLGGAS